MTETQEKPTFLTIAAKVLEDKQFPLTPEEIWEEVLDKGLAPPDKARRVDAIQNLRSVLYKATAIGKHTEFAVVEGKPKRFILRKNHNAAMPTWLGGNS